MRTNPDLARSSTAALVELVTLQRGIDRGDPGSEHFDQWAKAVAPMFVNGDEPAMCVLYEATALLAEWVPPGYLTHLALCHPIPWYPESLDELYLLFDDLDPEDDDEGEELDDDKMRRRLGGLFARRLPARPRRPPTHRRRPPPRNRARHSRRAAPPRCPPVSIGRLEVFLAECCDFTDEQAVAESTDVYDAYRDWCDSRAERPLPPRRLADALALRTVTNEHQPGRTLYRVSIRPPSPNGSSSTPNLDRLLAQRRADDWR